VYSLGLYQRGVHGDSTRQGEGNNVEANNSSGRGGGGQSVISCLNISSLCAFANVYDKHKLTHKHTVIQVYVCLYVCNICVRVRLSVFVFGDYKTLPETSRITLYIYIYTRSREKRLTNREHRHAETILCLI